MAKVAPDLAAGHLAASARVLAAGLDEPGNSLTSKSLAARTLREAMDRLAELMPPEETGDGVDDLAARRASRIAGGTATTA